MLPTLPFALASPVIQVTWALWSGLLMGGFTTVWAPRLATAPGITGRALVRHLSTPSWCEEGQHELHGPGTWPLVGWLWHRGHCSCGAIVPRGDLAVELGGMAISMLGPLPWLGTPLFWPAWIVAMAVWLAIWAVRAGRNVAPGMLGLAVLTVVIFPNTQAITLMTALALIGVGRPSWWILAPLMGPLPGMALGLAAILAWEER